MKRFINNARLAELAGCTFRDEIIKEGPIVYSRTHTITTQFPTLAKMGPCVLITSFSDACCTSVMARRLPPNVRRWFSNNVSTSHPRVTPVPIGIRTSPEGEEKLRRAIEAGRPREQRNLVYMNFYRRIPREPNPRRGLYEQFQHRRWITTEGGFEHVPMEHFYQQMTVHPYTLSPPGAGPDCHRHWEAMMLGSIPIVLKSKVTRILDDLPALQVNNWAEVTEEKLAYELPVIRQKFNSPAMERCWFDYWEKVILEA